VIFIEANNAYEEIKGEIFEKSDIDLEELDADISVALKGLVLYTAKGAS